jgi:uncharacterized protein (DUF305 family)
MKLLTTAGAVLLAAAILGLVVQAQERAPVGPPGVIALMAAHDALMARIKSPGVAYSADPDLDFVTRMIPHHQGAIDMAKVLLEHGTDFSVREFAKGVIKAQEADVAEMTRWRAGHTAAPVTGADVTAFREALDAADRKMMAAMGGDHSHGGKTEQAFLAMMLPHHQGAIDIAAAEIRYGKDPAIRALAQKMMTEQVGEMIEMMEMLAELGHH